jgi:profilin
MLMHDQGKEGIVVYKTTQALLIGHHGEEAQTTVAFSDVATLGDYLKKMGY